VFDTLDAVVRRSRMVARNSRTPVEFLVGLKARVFAPDGMHVHHRLVRAGLSTRRAVALLWGGAVMFAVTACVLARAPLVGLVLLVVLIALAWRGGRALRSRLAKTVPSRARSAPHTVTVGGVLVPAESPEARESSQQAA